MASILELIVSGAVGGIAANFLATFLWQKYTKPSLEFDDYGKGKFLATDRGNLTKMVFRVPVENTGRSSATNCKAELRMRGWYEGDRYEVQTPVCWFREESTSIDINRGEQPTIQILRYEGSGPASVEVSIPEGSSWEDKAPIMKYVYDDNDEVDSIEYLEEVPKDLFVDHINWEEQVVTVTSHNAEAAEAEIQIGEEVTDSYGIEGNRIKVNQR